MTKTLYFIRHGQTQWNIEGRTQGQRNSPLTEAGRTQAQQVAAYMQTLDIDAFYSSTAQRAQDTAEIILAHLDSPPPLFLDARLQEQNFGRYEGLTQAEAALRGLDPAIFQWNSPYDDFPEGESLYTAGQRLLAFIDDMQHVSAQSIAIITHGGCLRSLAWQLSQHAAHPVQFVHPNTSLTKIHLRTTGPELIYWGKVV